MANTSIEWCTDVWNPTAGCDQVSPGCDHCYAMTMAKRLKGMGQEKYQQDGDPRTSGPGFLAHEWPAVLDQPLRWTKPRRIFVNSMSDLFHDNISDEYIAKVFAVMAAAPQHTFQILTKRHARMRSFVSSGEFFAAVTDDAVEACGLAGIPWPLPNVWLGVSVENQQWADIRVPALLDTPAAVRFLSCEPLLGRVNLCGEGLYAIPDPPDYDGGEPICQDHGVERCRQGCRFVDWVIVGGESGPGARPMEAPWARSLREQCVESGTPFLFKQWGSHDAAGRPMSKHAAGRELDGRTWDEYPAGVA